MSSKHFICKVCGGNEFELTEGFYHCTECYIRHEDVQEVVYEPDYDTKEDKKHSKVHKVANNASKGKSLFFVFASRIYERMHLSIF